MALVDSSWSILKVIIRNVLGALIKWILPLYGLIFLFLWLFSFYRAALALFLALLCFIPSFLFYFTSSLVIFNEKGKRYFTTIKRKSQNRLILREIDVYFKDPSFLDLLSLKILEFAASNPTFKLGWLKKALETLSPPSNRTLSTLLDNFFGYPRDIKKLKILLSEFFSKHPTLPLWEIMKLEKVEKKINLLNLLAESKTELVIEELPPFIHDSNENVRLKTIEIVSSVAADFEVALKTTLDALKDQNSQLRLMAVNQISKLSFSRSYLDPILRISSDLLQDVEPKVTDYALWLLYNYRREITSQISKQIQIKPLFDRHKIEQRKYQTTAVLTYVLPHLSVDDLNGLLSELLAFYLETKSPRIAELVIKILESKSPPEISISHFKRREILDFYTLFNKMDSKVAYYNFKQLIDHESLIGLKSTSF
ncbi:MAG: HEAT repeat domain-containing protein [Candidatus Hermodarchaeota archaeon]